MHQFVATHNRGVALSGTKFIFKKNSTLSLMTAFPNILHFFAQQITKFTTYLKANYLIKLLFTNFAIVPIKINFLIMHIQN